MNNRKGITAVEILIASAIIIIVLVAATSIVLMIYGYVGDAIAQTGLQSQARVGVERMVRDIRNAAAISCSGDTLTLTFLPNPLNDNQPQWQSQYVTAGGEIEYVPEVGGDRYTIVENVDLGGNNLFQYDSSNRMVTIELRVRNPNNDEYTRLKTRVRAKNVSP